MADKIEVIFGAEIAGLVAGVKQAEAEIRGLVAPIEEIKNAFSGMGEALAAAFAVEKIREFITEMGELGERTLNMAYVMGQSVGDIAQLQSMIRLSGGDADEASQSFVRFARFIQQVAEGNNRAVATLHNLHITEDEVKAHSNDLLALFQLFYQRISELTPSFRNLSAEAQEFGRGVLRLAGFMRESGESWDELVQRAQPFRKAMEDNAEGMADSQKKANELKDAIATLKVDAFGALKSTIDSTYASIMSFVQELDKAVKPAGDVKREMSSLEVTFRVIINTVRDIITILHLFADTLDLLQKIARANGEALHEIFIGIKNEIIAALTGGDIESAYERMMGRIEAITLSRGNAIIADWAKIAAGISSLFTPSGPAVGQWDFSEFAPRPKTRPLGTEAPGGGRGKDTTKSEYEAFAAEMRLEIAEADKDWAQISVIYDKWAAHAKEVFGAQSKEYREVLLDMTRAHQQHMAQIFQQEEQAYSTTRSIDASYLKQFEDNMKEMVDKHQISKQQMYGFDIQYAQQRYEIERKILENMIMNLKAGSSEALKVYQQLMELDAAHAAKLAEYNEKSAKDSGGAWTQLADKMSSQMSSAFMAVIQGTESVGQAFKKMLLDITKDLLSSGVKDAFMSLFKGTGQGMFSPTGLLGGLFGAAGGASGISSLFSFLPALALERGGVVPSAAGGWAVPSFQAGGVLAQLHGGEMVLPRDLSEGLQGAIRGGGGVGGGVTLNVNAWDTQSGAQALMRNSQDVARAMRSGWMAGGTSYRAMSYAGRYP